MHSEPNKETCVWTASDFPVSRGWLHSLSEAQVNEIMDAVHTVEHGGLPFHQLTPELFPIPKTREMLDTVGSELHGYPGFAVIGGLPVSEIPHGRCMLAYAGIMSHFGPIVDQTNSGDMSVDVKDTGVNYSQYSRAYHSNRQIEFHTDGAVLTGLLCLGEASKGGASVLVSSMAVFDELKRRRPDLIQVLEQGSHHHRRGEEQKGEKPYSETRIPIFSVHNGLLQCAFDHKQIRWAHDAGAPKLPGECEALDLFSAITADPTLQLHMDMKLGDIQIVNNFTVLHARTDYEDGEGKKRFLVRLWVETPDGPRTGRTVRELYVRASAHSV
jgi:hypothetical protein